ncbi:PD-(D/E)XK nuclease family protein [Salinibacterium sp. SWN167]|uniref:PD-(D/E)XK nuclease family protein n=1 Tax=Salinibacterium sp. SWN167 TaxID=2792054 RepID=UPI0018CF32E5|nr:PD-(D/E)XK nuclease family protein [Salinibacterium sp. SWN167]MBH0084187.1 PD-(D/E)XK nuclease family protein [Salinibacterium sp. SWN167]
MSGDLLNLLLPVLGRSLDQRFNVFDVMHHGTHEKQLSNVFGWLLDAGGSHNLGDSFLGIFINEINAARQKNEPPFPGQGYLVRQEMNTSRMDEAADIADIVIDNDAFRVVVENFHSSDGHGHDFGQYARYSVSEGRIGAVVLLCRDEDRSRLTDGWEKALVLTYSGLLAQLYQLVDADALYRRENPDVVSFVEQMHRKFSTEAGVVGDREVLKFLQVMTEAGEGVRFRKTPHEQAAEEFASDLATQARQRYLEARQLLQRIKNLLKSFADGPIRSQLQATVGDDVVRGVQTNFKGNYQWTVALELATIPSPITVQLKFGPSAWFANEQDPNWKHRVSPEHTDYSRVFVTRTDTQTVVESGVTLYEVLDVLDSNDHRLHGVILDLLGEASDSLRSLSPLRPRTEDR